MRDLQQVLNRGRLPIAGAATAKEEDILKHVKDRLKDLTDDQRERVLKCAVIWELQVEEPEHIDAQQAISQMRGLIKGRSALDARRAWKSLIDISGHLARLRGGNDMAAWLAALSGEGIEILPPASSPIASLVARRRALARYAARLVWEGSRVDLRALGAELPTLLLEDADAKVRVATDPDDDRARSDLIWAFLRRVRAVLTGLPGGGKSTAVKRLAGELANRSANEQTCKAGFPFAVHASLRDVNALSPQSSFQDRLIACAIRDDRPEDQIHLRSEIESRLDNGSIALLLDSLDETYQDRGKVVGELERFLSDLPSGVCVLVATRDIAYGHAATLGWPSLRLLAPEKVETAVKAILEAAAAAQTISGEEDRAVGCSTAWSGSERSLRKTTFCEKHR